MHWQTHLVGVNIQILVQNEPSDEFAVEKVVRRVDRPQAVVRVVVGVLAKAEWTHCKEREEE